METRQKYLIFLFSSISYISTSSLCHLLYCRLFLPYIATYLCSTDCFLDTLIWGESIFCSCYVKGCNWKKIMSRHSCNSSHTFPSSVSAHHKDVDPIIVSKICYFWICITHEKLWLCFHLFGFALLFVCLSRSPLCRQIKGLPSFFDFVSYGFLWL